MSEQMRPGLTLTMAAATGLAVANIYYNQPMLGLIAKDFNVTSGISIVPASTLLGFALGLVLLVPLSDTIDRRKLILWQTAGLVLSLTAAALAQTPELLVLSSIAVGLTATIAQQIIPFASELAPAESRGRIVGTVMSGLLIGILLARTLSGFVGEYFSWRIMFGIGAIVAMLMGILLSLTLPRSKSKQRISYHELMFSLVKLARSQPALRRAVLIQGSLFATFNAFWTTLALLLQDAPFHFGSHIAGLFGIIGLVGILVSPVAGRFADKRGPHLIIGLGILLVLAGFIVFAVSVTILGLCIGAILLDAGLMMAMVSNQTVIFSLDPKAQSRINTVYMTGLFLAGAAGSVASSFAWNINGWQAVTGMGIVFALTGLIVHLDGQRKRRVRISL